MSEDEGQIATPVNAVTDATLMAQLADGNTACLGQLYERHHRRLRNTLAKRWPRIDASDLEDLVQEVFLEIDKYASRYVEQDRFLPWFYRVAFRAANGWQKKQWLRQKLLRRHKRPVAMAKQYRQSSPESDSALRQLLQQVMEELSDDMRTTLWLHYVDELSGNEIADVLGIRPATVYSRLNRARELLTKHENYTSWMQTLKHEEAS